MHIAIWLLVVEDAAPSPWWVSWYECWVPFNAWHCWLGTKGLWPATIPHQRCCFSWLGHGSESWWNEAKPPYAYVQLITQAIMSSVDKQLTTSGIYTYITAVWVQRRASSLFVSDIAIFVLKRDVKLQLTLHPACDSAAPVITKDSVFGDLVQSGVALERWARWTEIVYMCVCALPLIEGRSKRHLTWVHVMCWCWRPWFCLHHAVD